MSRWNVEKVAEIYAAFAQGKFPHEDFEESAQWHTDPLLPRPMAYYGRDEIASYFERFTVSRSRRAFVYPARHFASSDDNPDLPAMGQRLRLKASVDISRFPRQSRIVLRALQEYGMIVADNGSDWFLSGAPSSGWNNDDLRSLRGVRGSDFEVVDESALPRPR